MRSLVCATLMVVASGEITAANSPASGPSAFIPQPACSSLPSATVEYSTQGLPDGLDVEPNKLSDEERRENWRLLFDGRSLKGWSGFQRSTIPSGWRAEDGALTLPKFPGEMPSSERGDIRTVETFDDFELRLQWAIAPGGNGGIFFFVREGVEDRIWKVAPEVQILDDARHEDGVEPSHRAGGLYDIYPPKCDALRPAGEYNDVRLVVQDGHVEHWLNGYRVAQYEIDSADFGSRVAQSKFRDMKEFAKVHRGYLALQDHGDEVRFRSIRIRKL